MKYSVLQKVTPALLKTQAQQMMSMCFWRDSHDCRSRSSSTTRDSGSVVIRIAYFKTVNWVGFNFCKYRPDAVEVFRKLPKSEQIKSEVVSRKSEVIHLRLTTSDFRFPTSERLFYEIKPNLYASFKVWCVDGQHFEKIISFLKNSPDIELEFVISEPSQIPEVFQPLNLIFYERSGRERRERRSGGAEGKSR